MSNSASSKAGGVIAVLFVVVAVLFGIVGAMSNDDPTAPAPGAGPVFGATEASRLVQRLDAAAQAQGVCYGWQIDSGYPMAGSRPLTNGPSPTTGPTTAPAPGEPTPTLSPAPSISLPPDLSMTLAGQRGVDFGSNHGVATDPRLDPTRCPKWIVFTADYFYSSEDEEWSSVTRKIETNLPANFYTHDLDAMGLTQEQILGDNSVGRLADSIGALPLLVSERGLAPAVPEAAPATPPSGDEVAGPGLGRYIAMGIGGILIIGGVAWMVTSTVLRRRNT